MRKRYTNEERELALSLIRSGLTYQRIKDEHGFAKSTLSYWVASSGNIPDKSKQLAHLKKAREKAVVAIRKGKSDRERIAAYEAERISHAVSIHDEATGKAMLSMLYWAEGGKQTGNFKFTNTDSELVLLFLQLLRRQYPIDEARLRVGLQIHSYHNQEEIVGFWSEKLQIPASQFWKIYIKPRSGKRDQYRRNFYGICNLHYSSTAIQRELLSLGHAITRKVMKPLI